MYIGIEFKNTTSYPEYTFKTFKSINTTIKWLNNANVYTTSDLSLLNAEDIDWDKKVRIAYKMKPNFKMSKEALDSIQSAANDSHRRYLLVLNKQIGEIRV